MENATRFYNVLMKLYPRSYRNLFGAQMLQTFLDHYQDVQASEGGVNTQFWLALIADEIPNIAQQHATSFWERNSFLNFAISKLVMAAMLFIPLYLLFYALLVKGSLALPHIHVHGITALMTLALLLLVPAAVSIAVSYILASAFVTLIRKRNEAAA